MPRYISFIPSPFLREKAKMRVSPLTPPLARLASGGLTLSQREREKFLVASQ